MATTPPLRIRIPYSSYEENVGDEFVAFGDLCQYIKPTEACGTCPVDHEDACTLCLALALKKPTTHKTLVSECMICFDKWFKTLLKRKQDEKNHTM